MSTLHSIHTKLDAKYTPENIFCILNEGIKNNFIYYNDVLDTSPIINLNNVIDKILSTDSENEDKHIIVVFKDTNFLIWFFKTDKNQLDVSIGAFKNKWQIESMHEVHLIDFARYIKLLLKLCKTFTVLELKTEVG